MFELSVALKYLIPRKKQLSVSLIALLSVVVISLVVWLVLVFLSVTEGIEKNWLRKLTTLNAPVRITPAHHYFSSYYYQVDGIAANSQYTLKNIAEKSKAVSSDPYNPLEDGELGPQFPRPDLAKDGTLKDPVKGLISALSSLKNKRPDLSFQDFELSGALLRLQLLRPGPSGRGDATQGYMTQVSYLASFPDQCPGLASLILPPSEKDLNHLLYLAGHSTELSRQDAPVLTLKATKEIAEERIQNLLQHVAVHQLKPRYSFWQLPQGLIPENRPFLGIAQYRDGQLNRIDIPVERAQMAEAVKVWKEGNALSLEHSDGRREKISLHTPLLVDGPLLIQVEGASKSLFRFKVKASLQGETLRGEIGLEGLEIAQAKFGKQNSYWFIPQENLPNVLPLNEAKEAGVLVPKAFLDTGVMIGDRGYLAYSSATSSALQEHRMPVFVAGFYDPGILSVGNKCILVPPFVTRTINASSSSFNLDKTQANGMLVWFDDLDQAQKVKEEILLALHAQGLEDYWKVMTFHEYDFAKDLMQQFQSDKYLFALVAIIILVVACCNIISLLVLLVNDKKKEIGILQAMGASRLSIAMIFGCCGVVMGILSSIFGIGAALLTLHNIDSIVQLLSFIQGRDAFNIAFFGKSLPGQLSHNAMKFILMTTPLLSLLAGLIPAIKACRLRPSEILRSE